MLWFTRFASPKAASKTGSSDNQSPPQIPRRGFIPKTAVRTQCVLSSWLPTLLVAFLAVFGAGQASAQSVDWVVNLDDVGSDPIAAGGTILYNITVSNDGADASPSTTISFAVAAGTTFTGATGTITACTPVPSAGPSTVTCTVPPLAPLGGQVVTLTPQILTTTQGVVTFRPTITDPLDTVGGNSAPTETTTIRAGADIALSVVGPATATSGSVINYTYTALNNGGNAATNVVVQIAIPVGLTAITPPAGCVVSGANYNCTIAGPIAVGSSVPLAFSAQVSAAAGSTIASNGTSLGGSAPDPQDPIFGNNSANFQTIVSGGTDLSIRKARSPGGTLLVGDAVSFTLNPRYTGDSPSGITVLDSIPANYAIDTVVAPGWVCAVTGQDVSCTRTTGTGAGANVALGAITINTTVVSAGTPTNTATISATGPTDQNPGNNSDTDGGATINLPTVDHRANKSGPSPALVVVGNSYDFAISSTNIGNAAFVGTLRMTDALPAGLDVTAYTLNGWTCTPAVTVTGPASIVCERVFTAGAPLAAGATTPDVTLTTTATAAGSIVNGMTVSAPIANIGDLNAANDTITYGVTGSLGAGSADISVLKSVSLATLPAGDVQTVRLEVVNAGPQPSATISLTDNFTGLINNGVGPIGQGYISEAVVLNAATGISCTTASTGGTSRQLTCSIANLPVCTPGANCPVITVQVRYGGDAGSRTNSANAISSVTADPALGNNSGSATFAVEARADVTVQKTDNADPVAAGQNLTYTIVAGNAPSGLSLSAAADVTITDTLPLGVTFVSATPSTGSCSVTPTADTTTGPGVANRTVTCNVGTVANGAQQIVAIVVRPNFATRGTTLRNDVVITTSTVETDTTNNSAFAETAVGSPRTDILVNKGDSIDPLPLGTDTVYTIDVVNDGPSSNENVVVTDVMPGSILSYQSHSAPGATCGIIPAVGSFGQTLQCTYPVIAAGVTRTITITARGETKGVGQNNVSISSDEIAGGFDFESGNNASDEDTTVRSRADVQVVSKVATPATVNLREPFTYAVVVRNNAGAGLAEADDVVVSDTLPAGMELTGTPTVVVDTATVDTPVCVGAVAATSFSCNFGTMSSGAQATITVPVRVITATAAGQSFTNTASIVTSSIDVVPGNNSNSGPVVVNASSIAGTVFRDFADDGTFNGADSGIGAVVMTLTGTTLDGQPITRTVNTLPGGTYLFDLLPPGTYTISQGLISDGSLTNGQTDEGTSGGTVEPSLVVISAITLPGSTDATEYDFPKIPGARVIIAKAVQAGPTVNLADGSFTVTFRLAVDNPSIEALINMEVTDTLVGASPNFGSFVTLGTPATDPMADGTYTLLAAPSGSCGGLNAGYNGSASRVVATGFGLLAGGDCTIDLQLRVQPTDPLPPLLAGGARYFNQARVVGEGADSGQTSATNPQLADLSDDGTTIDANGNGIGNETGENDPTPVVPALNSGAPAISLDIQIADITDANGNGIPDAGDVIIYTFIVTNTGPVDLIDVNIDPIGLLPGLSCTTTTLAVGETKTMVCTGNTYVITPADQAFGTVTLSGTTSGQSIVGQVVDAADAVVSPLLGPSPLSITKTVDQSQVKIGDVVTFTITVENTSATLSRISNIVDQLPAGLIYQAGTATLNTVLTEPNVAGRTLTWPNVSLPTGSTTVITLDVLIGGSLNPGDHDNRARVIDPASGLAETADAIATIRLIAEPVFSCSTVIGRVFEDPNQDGYYNGEPEGDGAAITDQTYYGGKFGGLGEDLGPEKGMPNVRLIAPNGFAVSTDQFGRFSIPCAALPFDIGSNFMLKLDTRTLPEGYRLSTENPRVVRLTQGMLTKMNFGVARSKLVKVDLNSNAFVDGKPRAELVAGVTQLVAEIASKPSMLRLTYVLGQGEDKSTARKHLRAVEKLLRKQWPANGKYQLNIETVIQRAVAGAVNE
jgi:uncharacterized repeat protein (TIGR01451 family)/fimbrial isopeptide formation D2 family protein